MRLDKQFSLASLFVIGLGMLGFGYWINNQIREGVIQHTASTTTLYMESFVEPLAQGMDNTKSFDEATQKAFDNLLSGPLEGQLMALKIWNLDSSIAYSNFPELIGQKFEADETFTSALQGQLTAELGHTDGAENVQEKALNMNLLEVYSPLYDSKTGKMIGIGEFYLNSDALANDLWQQTVLTWLVVAAFTLAMVGILSAIMFRASSTIDQQKLKLHEQVTDLSKLLNANENLNGKIRFANERATILNDRLLNRLGSDLHDGPAQLMAFALLRLSSIFGSGKKTVTEEVTKFRDAIETALSDIRMISSGMNMPQLEGLSLKQVLELAISNHSKITRTKVNLDAEEPSPDASLALKATLYRIVQEGLNNAFKHGGGIEQLVTLHQSDDVISLTVSDKGKGFVWNPRETRPNQLGLVGLQNRAQALGGSVAIVSSPGKGCSITIQIPMNGGVNPDGQDSSHRGD